MDGLQSRLRPVRLWGMTRLAIVTVLVALLASAPSGQETTRLPPLYEQPGEAESKVARDGSESLTVTD